MDRLTGKNKWLVPAIIVIVAGMVALVYFFMDEKKREGEEQSEPEDVSALYAEMELPGEEAIQPFAFSAEITGFAAKAVGSAKEGEAVQAIFEAIVKLREEGKWKPYHQREPRSSKPLTAEQLLSRLESDASSGAFEALSYELACLLLAATRSQGLDTSMVEISAFKGEKRPADPAGKLGRFGVILNQNEEGKPAPLFDPFGGRSRESALADYTVLTDREAAASFFGIGALSLLVANDMSEALKLNEIAIKLAPSNPYFRSGRGLIFAGSGVPNEALAEFEKAVKQRSDAVQRANLAEILMLADPTGKRAEAEVLAALDSMPDYSRAHALKAMIHLLRRESDEAETELALAERLDPDSPTVAMFWAQYHASKMQSDEAIAKAKKAVRLSGESVSSLLALAGLYKGIARFDEMRTTLDKVFAKADSTRLREQVKQLFGYEPSAGGGEEKEVAAGADAGPGGDSRPGASGLRLELGGGGLGGKGRGLKLGGDPGSGLGGGGQGGLKLDLELKQ